MPRRRLTRSCVPFGEEGEGEPPSAAPRSSAARHSSATLAVSQTETSPRN